MSKEHPILFSGPLVRAILDGRKTQTRRLLRVQPELPMLWYPTPVSKRSLAYDGEAHFRRGVVADFAPWKVGDRLWVRETWASDSPQRCAYRADGATGAWVPDGNGGRTWIPHERLFEGAQSGFLLRKGFGDRWRPSIHMPRWASRLTLEVTEVRVQRLQDISEEDAQAEGVVPPAVHAAMTRVLENPADNGAFHRKAFRAVWDSLDPGGWDRNPWVWAVSFRLVQG